MKARYLSVILFIFVFSVQIYGQDKADSLLKILNTHNDKDTLRVNLQNQLAYEYYLSDPAKAIQYANSARTLADSIAYEKGAVQAYRQMGLVSWTQSNLSTSLNYFFKSLKLAEKINDRQGIADVIGNIGLVYNAMGNYQQAKKYHTRSLALQRILKNKIRESVALNNLGDVCRYQKDFINAIKYYNQALELRTKAHFSLGEATNIRNIGNVYEEMTDFPTALKYYFKSLLISNSINDLRGVCQCKNDIASAYLGQKKYKEAKNFALESLRASSQENFRSFMRDSYELLSKVTEAQGNLSESLKYFRMYSMYKDSVQNLKVASEISYQQLEYETQKKQTEIDMLTKDAILNQVIIDKKNSLLILVSLMLAFGILFFLILFKNYSHQRLINGLLKEKNLKIAIQSKEIAEQRDELVALNEEITAQQEEMMISRDAVSEKNIQIAEMHNHVLELNQNLEKKVAERTASLKKQNTQLVEYAFINAHKLRAPLASILGLVNLLMLNKHKDNLEEMLIYLKESSERLDTVIKSIGQTLEKGLDIYDDDDKDKNHDSA
jgi:tetratricopeptide (TPR) repeat protein